MSAADEIIVKLTAQGGDLNAGMDQAAAKVKASTDAMSASVASSMNTFRDFDNIQKGSIKTAQDVANAQATLAAAQASCAYSTEELAAKQAILDAAMTKLPKEVEAATVATNGFASALTRNSRTAYSASALISDALTGQFSRSRREIAALANETGVMGNALGLLLSPIGLAVAAAAAFAAVGIEGANNWATLRGVIVETNGALGLTAQELQDIATSAAFGNQTMGDARDAVEKLGATGEFTGEQLKMATAAAVDLGNITGESADKAAAALLRMAKDPQKELIALNDQYGFLSEAQAQDIANLIKQGDQYDALNLILKDTQDGLDKLAEKVDEQRSPLGELFDFWHRGFSNMMNDLEDLLDGNDLVKFWNDAAAAYNNYSNQVASGSHGLINLGHANLYHPDEGGDGEASARAKQEQKGRVSGILDPKRGGQSEDSENESSDNQVEQQKEQLGATKQELIADWQQIANSADVGSKEWTNALNHINELQKQVGDEAKQAADKAQRAQVEAARKSDAATMQGLEVKRAATQEYSAQRIAIDANIVATAEKLYGQDSSQYRAALQQKLSDTREFAQRQKEFAVTQADSDRQVTEAKISFEREQAQTEFDSGNITAQQLLQINLNLDRRKLAADVAYYNAKKVLDANDVKQALQDSNQIVLAKTQANIRMEKDEQKFFKDSEKNWKHYSQRIAGSVQTAVNGMLFQHQTLKQGVASIAESMAENFIEVAVMKPLEKWITAEGMKLTASLGTLTTQTTAEETQRAASTAADIADKTAGVIRAAGLAGAQGTASFAGAPWPVDIGAPAFGVAMMATAASFASMTSASGGWERVPADGMMTQLHKDEMVLPKHVADPVRNMAKSGSGGGDHFHIHAADAKSFMDMARRRPGDMAKMARQLKGRGYRV